ncbi:GIN domain-containing protein [Hyphomonas sp.]|uniref:GIN domain-containing protein n=1 Tax=Hyphomonas sp. TaxID=87 RepID=UPI00391C375B
MTRPAAIPAAFVASLVFAALPAFAGTQSVNVGAFTQIETRGAMNVVFEEGPQRSVIIETDGNDFSDAVVTVRNGVLTVERESLKRRGWFGNNARLEVKNDGRIVRVNGRDKPVYTVRITAPSLERFTVAQSSTGDIRLGTSARFEGRASSGSRMTVAGRPGTADLTASSAARIDAGQLFAGTLKASGSSSAVLNVATAGASAHDVSVSSAARMELTSAAPATFKVSATSGSHISLTGPCRSIAVSATSGATVNADTLSCESANVRSSSGASVNVAARDLAEASSSSGSSVTFAGAPPVRDINRSSGASVSFRD